MKFWIAEIYFGSQEYFCGIYTTEEKAQMAAEKASKHVNDPCQYHMRPSVSEVEVDGNPLDLIPHVPDAQETYWEYRKTQPMNPVLKAFLDERNSKGL